MPKDTIDLEENVVRFRTEAPKSRLSKAFEIKALADNVVELFLYGEIGWDVSAKEIIDGLRPHAAAGNKIRIRTNSPGGDVIEGYAIGNWIKSIEAEVEVYVDGLAASMASYIAAVADRVVMPRNSMQMIHRPWGYVVGTADDMERRAQVLSKMQEVILTAYEEKQLRTLGSVPEGAESLRDLMWADTYLTAEECLALGLADEITDEISLFACIRPDIAERFAGKVDAALVMSEDAGETDAQEDTAPEPTAEELAAAEAAAAAAAEAEAARLAEEAAAAEAARVAEEAEAAAAITAVCRAFEAEARAPEFISAKASLVDVRKALWKAAAEKDAAITTDPTPPAAENKTGDAYANQADEVRKKYAAALRG